MIYPPVLTHSYRQAILPYRNDILATAAGEGEAQKKGNDRAIPVHMHDVSDVV